MGMIADFFQREGKKEVVQQRLKSERRKGKKSEGRCLRRGKEMKSRSEAVEEEREERRDSRGEFGERERRAKRGGRMRGADRETDRFREKTMMGAESFRGGSERTKSDGRMSI